MSGKLTIFHADGRVVIEPIDKDEFGGILEQWREMGDSILDIETEDSYFAFHPLAINSMAWQGDNRD